MHLGCHEFPQLAGFLHLERGKLVSGHDGFLLPVRRGKKIVYVGLKTLRVLLQVGKLLTAELECGLGSLIHIGGPFVPFSRIAGISLFYMVLAVTLAISRPISGRLRVPDRR